MKKSVKIGLKIFGVAALICGVGLFCIYILPVIKMFHDARQQMLDGQKYMDSLTEEDFQVWTARTQKYLSKFTPTNWVIEAEAIPPDLKELKIISVYCESSNSVDYVWMGGFDHTMLHVERLTNGQFEFSAIYNDESNRVIWPK
jgi:hypothetical protein